MARSGPQIPVHPSDRLVGHSPAMQGLRAQIRHLAAFDTVGNALVPTLLLQGETGTGKGLVARVIHESGPRAQGPFIDINCAAIPETLLEVELFGFEAGTFTDAKRAKPGLLESAVHGTLFLDEIDALSLPLQAKLLSALEEKRVRRLGAVAERQLDVKLIAATPTELRIGVTAGRFRSDLYHRLAVVVLDIPPLRERGVDMVGLAQHFLQQYAQGHGLVPKRLSREAEGWLQQYDWPGNVRELSHLMERVTLLRTETVVSAPTLEELCLPRPQPSIRPGPPAAREDAEPLDEAAWMRQALAQTGGNVVRAAQLLGISRGALRYRMRQYGIGRPRFQRPSPMAGEETGEGAAAGSPTVPIFSHQAGRGVAMSREGKGGGGEAWEQRPVAVLAIDMAWPEEVELQASHAEPWTLATRWHHLIAEKVQGFGGLLLQHALSPLTALFGLPQTLEQLPQRAVQVALAIRHAMAAESGLEGRLPCPAVRIAVHLGQVLVDGRAYDPTARLLPLGETLSWPVRLLGHAMPGDILLSPPVGRLVEGWFELQAREGVAGPALSDGVGAYSVMGVGPTRSPLEVYGKRPLSRFVGREREIAMLRDLLAQVEKGHGQVVGLVGEPGVGKSRLCYELTQVARPHGWLILESSPVAYGQESPYLPIMDLLKTYCQLEAREAGWTIRDQVTNRLQTLDEALTPMLPAVLALLDVPVEDPHWQALEPLQRRQRTLEACTRLWLRESQVQPLLLVVENLHWIDSETQAVLDRLVDSLPAARILLVVNYRPEYQQRWGGKTSYTQLRLDPLSSEPAEDLLHALVGDDRSLAPLKPLLIGRTAGNPFFLEESVRTLVETQVLVGEPGTYRLAQRRPALPVPATVQAVLAARIDRLPPAARHLLQMAAVIGPEVPGPLLQAMAERPEEALHRDLAHLQAAEFLYETRLFPERAYTFKHALTQQVAYQSLLTSTRQRYHAQLAQALEVRPETVGTQPELLAHHYTEAGLTAQAVGYWQRAGKRSTARSAYEEAVTHLTRGLEVLQTLPDTPERARHELDMQIGLGQALMTTKGRSVPEVGHAYTRARELCQQAGEVPQLAAVLKGLCQFYQTLGDLQTARELGEQLLALAQGLREPYSLAQAHLVQGETMFYLGEFVPARAHLDEALAISAAPQDHSLPSLSSGAASVNALGTAVFLLWLLGYPDQALTRSHEMLTDAQELQHAFSLARARYTMATLHKLQGEADATQQWAEVALAIMTEREFGQNLASATFTRGWALAAQERYEEGIAQMRQGLAARRAIGAGTTLAEYLARLGEMFGRIGQAEEGLRLVAEALVVVDHGGRWYEAEIHRIKGELLLRQAVPDAPQGEACFQQALAVARLQQAKSWELRAVLSLSRLWQQQGKRAEARELLAPLYSWFTEGFDTPDLQEAKALLEDLGR